MSDTFVIGDLHLGHWNVIGFSHRPFSSIEEHDETILRNWNSIVKHNDTVIIDGDFALTSVNRTKTYLSRLNGNKIMVLGDHDKQIWQCVKYFKEITKFYTFTPRKDKFIAVFHWCIRCWPRSHYNSYHIYGHSHGTLPPIGKSWDCGVDTECKEIGHKKFYPYHMDEILQIMDLRPNNPNYIKDRGKVKREAKIYWERKGRDTIMCDVGHTIVKIEPCCDEILMNLNHYCLNCEDPPIELGIGNKNFGDDFFDTMKFCYKCGKPIKFIEVKE
jgi:calcineurin-like phosphoesterase family protein